MARKAPTMSPGTTTSGGGKTAIRTTFTPTFGRGKKRGGKAMRGKSAMRGRSGR